MWVWLDANWFVDLSAQVFEVGKRLLEQIAVLSEKPCIYNIN